MEKMEQSSRTFRNNRVINIWIKELEPIETRYTVQWKDSLPLEISNSLEEHGIPTKIVDCLEDVKGFTGCVIRPLRIDISPSSPTEGGFLDFAHTNEYKAKQFQLLVKARDIGILQSGDMVIFPDAWDPTAISLKYMSDLLELYLRMIGIWHAGSYDRWDFLGRIRDRSWSINFERSLYHVYDHNVFATNFHLRLFHAGVIPDRDYRSDMNSGKIIMSGQPHSVLVEQLESMYIPKKKKKQIVFPHRIAPEKQPEIFEDLEKHLPDFNFIMTMKLNPTKQEYHRILAESLLMFSANLQETLGITAMESVLVDTVPILPDRLSYTEMYSSRFLYPSEWTESFEAYENHRDTIIAHIRDVARQAINGEYRMALDYQKNILKKYYLSSTNMCNKIVEVVRDVFEIKGQS